MGNEDEQEEVNGNGGNGNGGNGNGGKGTEGKWIRKSGNISQLPEGVSTVNFNGTEGVKRSSRNGNRLYNLAVKGNDLTAYTRRFQELVLLCTRMVPNEEDKVERFIEGLPENIQGNVIAAAPTQI
ncbi:reverse transcriptase domain-containing protein [Tanacetum coccineum]